MIRGWATCVIDSAQLISCSEGNDEVKSFGCGNFRAQHQSYYGLQRRFIDDTIRNGDHIGVSSGRMNKTVNSYPLVNTGSTMHQHADLRVNGSAQRALPSDEGGSESEGINRLLPGTQRDAVIVKTLIAGARFELATFGS